MLRAYSFRVCCRRAPPSCFRATAPPLLRSLVFWLRSDFHRHDSVPFTGHADPPMIAIDAQQRLWRGGGGQAGDEIDDLVLWLLPLAVLLDLARTYDATDLPNRRPLALNPDGFGRRHVDRAPFNAPMRFVNPAPRRSSTIANRRSGSMRLPAKRVAWLARGSHSRHRRGLRPFRLRFGCAIRIGASHRRSCARPRWARARSDWHRLIDLAGLTNTAMRAGRGRCHLSQSVLSRGHSGVRLRTASRPASYSCIHRRR